jgi:hypothetical protein
MEIVIHGTKGGRKIFTPNKLPGLFDVTSNSPTGFVAFSLFVPRGKKLSGIYIINLLDEISKEYSQRGYIVDNNLGNVDENWDFIKLDSDETKPVDEHILSGTGDDAYIYFKNKEELQRCFDNPFQEEYKAFRQIYFVDKNFENKLENPLNALRYNPNANLTKIIKWDNPSYTLRDYHRQVTNGISIKIFANGIEKKIGEKIKKKDRITINFSRKYHEVNDVPEGNLIDPHIQKYLKIDEIENSLYVVEVPELNKSKLNVEISLYNSKGDSISDATITCKGKYYGTIPVNQNTLGFGFIGEQQKEEWTIAAQAGSLIGEKTIIPERDGTILKLTLIERKTIRLVILDENEKEISNKSRVLDFDGDNIKKRYTENIVISSYQPYPLSFIPKDEGHVYQVKLQKVNTKQLGTNGGTSNGGNGKKEPQKPFFLKILLGLAMASLLVFGGYYLVDKFWGDTSSDVTYQQLPSQEQVLPELSPAEIKSYVEGDSLFLEELNTYKDEWAKLKNTKDSVEYREYEGFIDKAIKKREALTNGDFAYFNDNKNEVKFSDSQLPFKDAVLNIKPNQYSKVKAKLGNVSQLTLTQIADSINKFLSPLENTKNPKEKNSILQNNNEIKNNSKSNNSSDNQSYKKVDLNEDAGYVEIIDYLKGSDFKIDTLKGFKEKPNLSKKIKASVELALEFWELNGDVKKYKTYYSYKNKVQKDKYLKNNITLKNFLESATNDTKYPKDTPGGKTLTLIKFIDKTK